MEEWRERTRMLVGGDALARLEASRVVVVGAGGVGAAAAEMIVRAGVGHVTVIDSDEYSVTNINRQLPATTETVGRSKVEVLRERLLSINPELDIRTVEEFLTEENIPAVLDGFLMDEGPLWVVDAIDTLSPKIALIQYCLKNGLRLVSSMGSGAKMDVTKIRIADISQTFQCPLAHMLRKRLHKLGIREGFLAVFSTELPMKETTVLEESRNKKSQVGTISYLPTAFGCACAQAVISGIV